MIFCKQKYIHKLEQCAVKNMAEPDSNDVFILASIHSLPKNNLTPNQITITIKRHKAQRAGDPSDFWYERRIPLSEIINIRKAYFSHNFDKMNTFHSTDYQRVPVIRDPGDTWEDPFIRRDDMGIDFETLTTRDDYVVQVRSEFLDMLRQ